MAEIKEIETWLKYNDRLLEIWNLKGKIKPGYRVLFHGPPGTGKTLTACLLGKYTNRNVYRIDLSVVVSKYIGETEKNLSRLFAQRLPGSLPTYRFLPHQCLRQGLLHLPRCLALYT